MKLSRIDHIVITTEHFEECRRFYTEVLGMKYSETGGHASVSFGQCRINIHRRKGEFLPAAAHPAAGSQDICLTAEGNIEEIMAELERRGWPVELGPVTRNGALGAMVSVYIRDPDKNLVEISVYC